MKLFGRRPGRPAADGYSVIDNELSVTGDIQTEGTIRVDGKVEGSLHRVDTLIIGAGGTVVGNIEAREVVIGGDLCGDLTVTGRVEVQASATVRGNIHAAAVMLQEGGTVHGHVAIHPIGSNANESSGERRLALTPSRPAAAIAQG
jgi:Integral membrane protein CcmA involved in cell shape determination